MHSPDLSHRCGASCCCTPLVSVSGHHLGTLLWVALRKPPNIRIQIGRVSRRGYSNDPRYGTPCACADGGFCRGIDAGHVPWRKQRSVADQGNKGATAPAARAVATKEDAEAFADPCAHFQGKGGTGSLEAGHYRHLPARHNPSDLPVVGRSWAEVASGRPAGSGGVPYSYALVRESQFQRLSYKP